MRKAVLSFLSMLALGAGCSSRASFFPDDGGADGGKSSIVIDGDGGKKKDGAAKDSDIDDADEPEEDAGKSDAKSDSGKKDSGPALPVCAPESTAGFSPAWKAPKPIHSTACTAANAQLVVDCNFDTTVSQTTCDNFLNNPANSACIQCVLTDKSATTYGPVIMDGSIGSLNVAGCIAALSGNTTSTGCGAKFQAVGQCRDYACASCPDPSASQQAFDDFQQCGTDADASECATYLNDAACADALVDTGGSAQACAAGTTFLDNARAIAKIFCSL